jgi:hypothetical protein
MTRYEELCDAFRQYGDDWTAYDLRARTFIGRLLAEFVTYINAPADQVRFLPPERDPADSENTRYSAIGAARLKNDGWWTASVQVVLTRGQGVYPEIKALLVFHTRVDPDTFTVRIGDSEQTHTISNSDHTTALQPIYKEAYERTKEYFTFGLQRFLDAASKKSERHIGFA